MKFIDLFCGIGGFHQAANQIRSDLPQLECVFASDIDESCQKMYKENFGINVAGDIKSICESDIPDHDLLFAGFPCQPFSIIGSLKGFDDTRGTLFFDIARILREKRPRAFILENVKMLVGHQKGRTLSRIIETLQELGYFVSYRVLNALDFGLPQKRERVLIVGFLDPVDFLWPQGGKQMVPLVEVLEKKVPLKYYASEKIVQSRMKWHKPDLQPTIWHENKSGNVSKYPYSCALRAGASYNYLLVDGERRLTEREMLRLQGFPDDYRIVCNYTEVRRQAGNSVPVPLVSAVLERVVDSLLSHHCYSGEGQIEMVLERRADWSLG